MTMLSDIPSYMLGSLLYFLQVREIVALSPKYARSGGSTS